ncbi:putative TetR-family transcriptional regulator [Frankia canadensis]|uniref:Putative TetR-family transcriptional regulator n=1 Tax=Frankia canadensis TaxID=1836972 RepID=A0A2I2KNW2_9ACTN|nr:TetR/AcrR family transcriptional regulator [Frankia canadensis]SNQ47329.1 putative TetR-family transcriptional regulator [Frankia canadensis]SOU54619.1 putative TetR-family transcriptional regulator [Frankia canadensis]
MPQSSLASPRPGGRPRDESRDDVIRAATLDLLAEFGYDGVTMDRVASRAGTGKATIYRRWPSKLAMVLDAINDFAQERMPTPDTGSLRLDLLEFFTFFHEAVRGGRGRIIAELISEMPRNPELRDALRAGMWTQRDASSRAIVEHGIARGELQPNVDGSILTEIGTAIILQRVLVTGDPVDRPFLETIVDDIVIRYAA